MTLNLLAPTPDVEVFVYRASLICTDKQQDEEDEFFYNIVLTEAHPGETVDDVTTTLENRSQLAFQAPRDAAALFYIGSEHTLAGEVSTVVPRKDSVGFSASTGEPV